MPLANYWYITLSKKFTYTHLYYCMLVLVDVLEFGILSHWNLYWINSDYLLTVSTPLTLYEFFPSIIIMYLSQFACCLKQGICLSSRLLSVLASLKGPPICPLLLLANFGNSVAVTIRL